MKVIATSALSRGDDIAVAINAKAYIENEKYNLISFIADGNIDLVVNETSCVIESFKKYITLGKFSYPFSNTGVVAVMVRGRGYKNSFLSKFLSQRYTLYLNNRKISNNYENRIGKTYIISSNYGIKQNILSKVKRYIEKREYLPEDILDLLSKEVEYEDFSAGIVYLSVEVCKDILRNKKFSYCFSDIGMRRTNNEDSCLTAKIEISRNGVRRVYKILIVADGAGGHGHGEVASREALFAVFNYLASEIIGKCNSELDFKEMIINAISNANEHILALRRRMLSNMATTLTMAIVYEDKAYIGHVGDSRAYILDRSEESIKLITRDHKLVEDLVEAGIITREQAKYHPQRNVITSALGMHKPRIDICIEDFRQDQALLLCSDGLTDLVEEYEIAGIMIENKEINKRVKELISLANRRGGKDNITVILYDYYVI